MIEKKTKQMKTQKAHNKRLKKLSLISNNLILKEKKLFKPLIAQLFNLFLSTSLVK